MKEKIVLIGGGGHCHSVIDVIEQTNKYEIIGIVDTKENIEHFAKYIDNEVIAQNDYNLSVSSYVEAEDTREIVDINKLNAELKSTVLKIDALRSEIDKIVESIENE